MSATYQVSQRITMPVRASGQKVRQVWTPEEDRILSHAVAKAMETSEHGPISWHKIASHLPGRNNKDCRKRWHYSIAHTIRKGTWTKEEDEKLLGAVDKYGARWSKVAVVVGSRNGDQCWKRWYDCLDPRIDKSAWTAEEDAKLLQEVAMHGRNWSEIVTKHFPNRTSLSAKNRYSILQRRREAAAEAVPSASERRDAPTQRPVPLLRIEEPPASPSPPPSLLSVPTGTGMGMDEIAPLTEGNVSEFLQQTLSVGDGGWYTDGTLSEVSTPRLPCDMDWSMTWSPNANAAGLVSGPDPGLLGHFGADVCSPGCTSTHLYPMSVGGFEMGNFYPENGGRNQPPVAPAGYSNGFLFPTYSSWY